MVGNCCINCVTSSVLSLLLCRNGCKIDKVAAKLAYFPPEPATYRIEEDPNTNKLKIVLLSRDLAFWPEATRAAAAAEVFQLKTSLGHTIPAIMFRVASPRCTILFSHSNAMDLGIMIDFFQRLSELLRVNMFCYEYTGYGASVGGPPSESKTYADIDSALEKLVSLGIPPNSIILYGQSVGSGPSCYMATQHNFRGLILHGGLVSGLHVVSRPGCCKPSTLFSCCDIYRNKARLRSVQCPVLLMHGCKDEVIDIAHSRQMHEVISEVAKHPPYWVPEAGHNNLVETNPQGYINALQHFLAALENKTKLRNSRTVVAVE